MNIATLIRERDEALLSLDKIKIVSYANKYNVTLPSSELAFWGGVHIARTQINSATPEQKAESAKWLKDHRIRNWFDRSGGESV